MFLGKCVWGAFASAPTPAHPMNEWRPPCPVLSSPAQRWGRLPGASLMEPITASLVSLCSCCLLLFQAYYPRQRTPPSQDVAEVGQLQFCRFCLHDVSGLSCSGTTCPSSWQSRVSVELSSNTIYSNEQFFFYQPSSLSWYPYMVIRNMYITLLIFYSCSKVKWHKILF